MVGKDVTDWIRNNTIKVKLNSFFDFLNFIDLSSLEIEILWNIVRSGLFLILDEIALLKTRLLRSSKSAPWFDGSLLKLGKQRDLSYHQLLDAPNERNLANYHRLRNAFKRFVRNKKSNFFVKLVESFKQSSERLWRRIHPFVNINKKQPLNTALLASNNPHFKLQDAVNSFSNYFGSILNKYQFRC